MAAIIEPFDKSFQMIFHGISYCIDVSVTAENMLCIDCETSDGEKRWGGEFADIEEITRKTGNYKRFSTFVKMLLSALTSKSGSVFVDLLTPSDLETIRNRHRTVSNSRLSTPQSNNKRYLIVTYSVEFDNVHYPLPLQLITSPSVEILQRTINRLRAELSEYKAEIGPNDYPFHEIHQYQMQIKRLESEIQSERDQKRELISKIKEEKKINAEKLITALRENEELKNEIEYLKSIKLPDKNKSSSTIIKKKSPSKIINNDKKRRTSITSQSSNNSTSKTRSLTPNNKYHNKSSTTIKKRVTSRSPTPTNRIRNNNSRSISPISSKSSTPTHKTKKMLNNNHRHLSPSPSNNNRKKSTSVSSSKGTKRSISRSPSISKHLSPKKVVYMKKKPTGYSSSSDEDNDKVIDETSLRRNRKKANNNNNIKSDDDDASDGEIHVQKMKQNYIDDSDDESNVEERLKILQQYLKKVKVGETKRNHK